MARIRMMETITGGRYDGRVWPPLGGALHVPAWEAAELVAAGHAVYEPDPALAGLPVPASPGSQAEAPPPGPRPAAQAPAPVAAEPPAGPAPAAPEAPSGSPQEAPAPDDGDGDGDGAGDAGDDDAAEDEDGGVPRPAVNHPKSAWVEYAVARGADRAGVERKNKADLMSEFGSRL